MKEVGIGRMEAKMDKSNFCYNCGSRLILLIKLKYLLDDDEASGYHGYRTYGMPEVGQKGEWYWIYQLKVENLKRNYFSK